jgi:uncharacterized protein
MALDDPPAVYSTRPTIEVGGMDYPMLNANIQLIRMQESLGGLSVAELTVTDWIARSDGSAGFGGDSGSPLVLGAGLRIFMGAAAVHAGEIFDGQIIAVEAEISNDRPPMLTVIAEDRLFSARRKRQSRILEQKSPADIARQIATDHNLEAEIRDGLDAPISDWIQQDESDLAFLRRVLARFDADVQIVGAKLQVGKISVDQRSAVTLVVGATLLRARITADVAQQVTEAKLSSFDPATGETVTGEADPQGCGPGSGRTGTDILNSDFAAIPLPLGRYGPMTQDEASKVAQTEYDRRARTLVTASGTAIGTSELRVGSWVTLEGVNPQFANVYAVSECTHRFSNADGYRTDFIAECAYMGEAA